MPDADRVAEQLRRFTGLSHVAKASRWGGGIGPEGSTIGWHNGDNDPEAVRDTA